MLRGAAALEGVAVALVGPLGAGKTLFVRGLAEGLGHPGELVTSPTYVICQEYRSPGVPVLAHLDLYRIASEAELEGTGFLDLLAPGVVLAVEWADRLPEVLPEERIEVGFEPLGARERRVRVGSRGGRAARAVAELARRAEASPWR